MVQNINDPRSTVGRYSRGNNVYGSGGSTPNPTGRNQYPSNLSATAAVMRKKRKAMAKRNPQPYPYTQANSLMTDYGGNYQ